MAALPKLYYTALSPPARAVWFMAKAIELKWEHREVNLAKMDQLKPEFLKMNPQHTIPVLDDNGTIISDSHSIMPYLVSKYGKDDSLYPKDLKLRAIIDQRLHFDSSSVFPIIRRILKPMILHGEISLNDRLREDAYESYNFLNAFLEGNQWVCGENLSLADFSLVASMTSLDTLISIDLTEYKNIAKWLERAKTWPFYHEVNDRGLEKFTQMSQGFLKRCSEK